MKKALIFLLVLLIGLQFIPIQKNQSDVIPETDFLEINEAPISISDLIRASCYDCHSDHTNYPWYGRIRPFAWLMLKHIDEGKEELNLSAFQDYSRRMQRDKVRSMISQIRDEEMPLSEYALLHPEAKLNHDERKILIEYLEQVTIE